MLDSLATPGLGAPPLWAVIPFAGLLASIAILPLWRPRWWHENRNKALVSAVFGVPVGVYVAIRSPGELEAAALEYFAFVCLLGSLYVISGGVEIRGGLTGRPGSNAALLAIGALIANVVGTTGAAMLLLRPYLLANRDRRNHAHLIVFYIFLVANCGGCLTPLGDPPLFLGFLKGVPFGWTLGLWGPWLFVSGSLLAVFYLIDRRAAGPAGPGAPSPPLSIRGTGNLVLLGGVVGALLAGAYGVKPWKGETAAELFQGLALGLLAAVSLRTTPRSIRDASGFSWHPLAEVAILFAGIFAAMIPALGVLRSRGASLELSHPWQFFWGTGLLSAFLDNAPTYLAFLAMGQYLPDEVGGTTHRVLAAISCGAVFFGAATYIGNGPNFMVKAMAEARGVKTPSFFSYLAWSGAILIPILAGATLLFFR